MTKRTEKVKVENLENNPPDELEETGKKVKKESGGELETFNFPLKQRSVQAKNLQEAEEKINKETKE